jgi:hypothetical protein
MKSKYKIISNSNIEANENEKNKYTKILKNKGVLIHFLKKKLPLSYDSFYNICLKSFAYPEEQVLFTYNPENYEEKEFDLENDETQHLLVRNSLMSNESLIEKKEKKYTHHLNLLLLFLNLILFVFAFFYFIHLIKISSNIMIMNSNIYYILNICLFIGLILNGLTGNKEFVFNSLYDTQVHNFFSIFNIIFASVILLLINKQLFIGKELIKYVTSGKSIYLLNLCVIFTEISSIIVNITIERLNK